MTSCVDIPNFPILCASGGKRLPCLAIGCSIPSPQIRLSRKSRSRVDCEIALTLFWKTVPAAGRAILQFRSHFFVTERSHELFELSESGNQIVVDELMKLDDALFAEVGRSMSMEAGSVIISENESPRSSLA
jgi:hypothetical protein